MKTRFYAQLGLLLSLGFAAVACTEASSDVTGSESEAVGSDSEALSTSTGPEAKVTICHIPPGNPANKHTITVGASAVPAHLAHGDVLGACQCKPIDGYCHSDVDCCDGNKCDNYECKPVCKPAGQSCHYDTECCDGNKCDNYECKPVCKPAGQSCHYDTECCDGNKCDNYECKPCP